MYQLLRGTLRATAQLEWSSAILLQDLARSCSVGSVPVADAHCLSAYKPEAGSVPRSLLRHHESDQRTLQLRNFSKHSKASNAKSPKGKHGKKESVREEDAAADAEEEVDAGSFEELMVKAVEHLQKELAGVRTGRANPGLIEHIPVNAHGEHLPLKACGTVVVRDNNSLAVSLYDPNLRASVETALKTSALGLNPAWENGELLVSLPRTSAEIRDKMVRLIHDEMEEARISVRHARQKAVDKCKKMAGSESDRKRALQNVQKLHDQYIKEVDRIGQIKERELRQSS